MYPEIDTLIDSRADLLASLNQLECYDVCKIIVTKIEDEWRDAEQEHGERWDMCE